MSLRSPWSSRSIAERRRVSTAIDYIKFAHAVDTIAAAVGEDPLAILCDDVMLARRQFQQLAEIAELRPEAARILLAWVRTAKTKKAANQIVRQAHMEIMALLEQNVPDDD